MTTRCQKAVRKAVGDVFSDEDIKDQLDRLMKRAARKAKELPDAGTRAAIETAMQELTKEDIKAALVERRMTQFAALARARTEPKLQSLPGDEAQKLLALELGSEKQGLGVSSSIDAEGRANRAKLWGQVEIGLKQRPGLMDRLCNFAGVTETGFDTKVATEMARLNGGEGIEPTGDDDAVHAARVLVAALRDAREMQNNEGAFIEDFKGYIVRQSHDAEKIAGGFWRELAEAGRRGEGVTGFIKALGTDWNGVRQGAAMKAFTEWSSFIKEKLDPKTFAGLEDNDVSLTDARGFGDPLGPDASLEDRFLYRIFFDIVTGRHEQLSGGNDLYDFRPAGALAAKVSKSRVLHFNSPEDWVDYNARYGSGNLFSGVMRQLDRAGQNTALMHAYGPSPDAARANHIEQLRSQARERGDPGAANKLSGRKVEASYEALTGRLSAPDNLRMAMIGRNIRAWEALTKLGSIVLSKPTDVVMAGHVFARAGAGFLAGYEGVIRGLLNLGSEDAKRAADLLECGAGAFAGHLTAPFHAADGASGWTSWATNMAYKVNLFTAMNEALKRGAAQMLSRHLGQEAEFAWDGLQLGTRETMQRFGIDQDMWEKARHGLQTAEDGRRYFTFEHIADAETALRFRTMIHNAIDDVVSEPRAREKVATTFGARPGTILGEAARAFSQFKGFLVTIYGRHLVPAAAGYAGYKPAALLAHFIVGTTLAGFIGMQCKQIAKGREPRPLFDENGNPNYGTWLASMAQGGGMGIAGDYVFGERNRNGQRFSLDTLAGPEVSDAEEIMGLMQQGRDAMFGDADKKAQVAKAMPGELTSFGVNHVPLVNTFYTRWALDYLVFWRLHEAASPGYLQRYQDRVEKEQGSNFIVAPTSVLAN